MNASNQRKYLEITASILSKARVLFLSLLPSFVRRSYSEGDIVIPADAGIHGFLLGVLVPMMNCRRQEALPIVGIVVHIVQFNLSVDMRGEMLRLRSA